MGFVIFHVHIQLLQIRYTAMHKQQLLTYGSFPRSLCHSVRKKHIRTKPLTDQGEEKKQQLLQQRVLNEDLEFMIRQLRH